VHAVKLMAYAIGALTMYIAFVLALVIVMEEIVRDGVCRA
jgi:hypothetical protein